MNNYKSFLKLKKELGDNYDFKLYEMGISAIKEIENLEQQCKKQKEVIDKIKDIFNNGTFEDGCDCILIEKLLEDKEVQAMLKIKDKVKLIDGTIATIVDIKNEPISLNMIYLIDKQYKGKYDDKYGYNREYYKKGTWFVYPSEIVEKVEEE